MLKCNTGLDRVHETAQGKYYARNVVAVITATALYGM